jgi:hypothetical protein
MDDIEARVAAALETEHDYMTEVFAQFVAEVRSNLIDEIELAYSKTFADLGLEIANLRLELVKLNGGAAGPIDQPNPISRLACVSGHDVRFRVQSGHFV